MADWLPKDPVTLAELGTAVGGAGLLGKFWDSLWAWRTQKQNNAKDLQSLIDGRLRTLLEADGERLAQLSTAVVDQSAEIAALRDETTGLKQMIKTLISHISSLETILRSKQIEVPPRPDLA